MAKGKKQRKNEDSDDEAPPVLIESDQDEVEAPKAAGGKKGKKDRKKKKDAELEEAQKELESIAAGDDDELTDEEPKPSKKEKKKKQQKKDSDDEEEPEEKKTNAKGKKDKKKKKQKDSDSESDDEEMEKSVPVAKKTGFAAFLMDDNSDEDEDLVDSDEAPVIIKAPSPEPKKKGKKDKKSKKTEEVTENAENDEPSNNKKDKKKKKGKKKGGDDEDDDLEKALAELNIETKADNEESKSAAQKKKEKKERQRLKQLEEAKDGDKKKEDTPEPQPAKEEAENEEIVGKKGSKEDKKGGKKPGKGALAAMQELLKQQQEEKEKAEREFQETLRREEEAEREREEKKRIEEEKKALKKQREKERKEQLRKEGKLLTAKQKAEKARAEQMLAAMRAQGMEVPDTGVKRGPRPGTRIRNKNKGKSQTPEADNEKAAPEVEEEVIKKEPVEDEKVIEKEPVEDEKVIKDEEPKKEVEEEKNEEDDVLDSWDAEPEEVEEEKKDEPEKEDESKETTPESDEDDEESDESDDEDDDSDEDDSEEDESSEDDTPEVGRERALTRIAKRKAENESKRTTDNLRAPVIVVMGHVDTGKTKILDKLRRTNVQDGEAGGITQQIGATNVPIDVIHEQCKMVNDYKKEETKLPGLLIIDTPGHESFSNLRDRGSSLCDFAILVVDIMHCLEPQTIESIKLLKVKKVPFVIALNKVDRLYEWKANRHKDIQDVLKSQSANTKVEFDKRAKEVITAVAEQGLNTALFYENPDPRNYISMIPTSAHSGDGMGNLMAQIVKLSQKMLAKKLAFSEELQASVLEVKAIPGLGTTIDIVLVNGHLREGQTMVVAGQEGPIVTQIKALLTPQKMQDLRVKNSYIEHKEIRAAQGVKIAAKELEKTVAGLNLLVANHPDEVEVCKEEMSLRLQKALSSFKVKDRGVFVQASTLGSLEALLDFLRSSKIPYAGVKIGPVVKKDVMKASVMLEHEPKYCIILAFDVKIERDAQEMADSFGVKIFQADIIYHLFDRFTQYQEELKKQKREEFKHVAVFPCKFKILPNFVFNSRSPIVAGAIIEAGVVKHGTPICVPSKGVSTCF